MVRHITLYHLLVTGLMVLSVSPVILSAADTDDYVIKIKTDNTGASSDTQFTVPVVRTSGAGYNVDCNNDGIDEATGITGNNSYTCNYPAAGTYTIRVKDNNGNKKGFKRIRFYVNASTQTDVLKLLSIEQWGTAIWSSMVQAYRGADNLAVNATDIPDLSKVSSLRQMFQDCTQVNPDVSNWDISHITNLSSMFQGCTDAAPDVSTWNVSQVTNMTAVFRATGQADPDVSNWDTSKVTNMSHMFQAASSANPDVSHWDTSSVTKMNHMFYGAGIANPDVSHWNVSQVTTFYAMFRNAIQANPDVSNWNTSSATTFNRMFSGAAIADPDVSNWNTASVTNMAYMFNHASTANPDISRWDTSSVTTINNMFFEASAFNRSLGPWDISNLTSAKNLFRNTGLTVANYDDLLISWSQKSIQNNVTLSSDAQYCQGDNARTSLIDNNGWTIKDGGANCVPCADMTLALTAYNWRTVSFPCDTGSNDIEALLGTSLGTYGDSADWVMYEQVDTTGSNSHDMRLMESGDTVSPGKGYWIITALDKTMSIDTSLSGLAFTTDEDDAAYGVDGSTRSPLFSRVKRINLPASSDTHQQNYLIGNAFPLKISISNLFFSHHTNSSGTYNEWADSSNDSYRDATLYIHNSSGTTSTGYEARTAGTPGFSHEIQPMESVFLKLKKNSDTLNNYLLLPNQK
ncbi:BspA family leucine-rich repeat surface protein [Sulfurovum sp.]|uniref:BspA family leucine-rich repeat surface protein n=1 Tax=Sulfurovum sp. TaxID=1969726 RepID=UPI0025CF3498|nr:BspA family leucine-rich repeat surface protein [Sulfurovum sp.]